jgi:hypothetical protein
LDQAEKADLSRIGDVFWTIDLVWRSSDYGSEAAPQIPDMAWAEALMLKALADVRPCSPKYEHATKEEKPRQVRQLAVEHGEFDKILCRSKCAKVVPVLCDYMKTAMEAAQPGSQFDDYEAVSVARALFATNDPAIEQTAIDVFNKSLASEKLWYEATKASLAWLVQRKLPSAIPLITSGLSNRSMYESVYYVVVGTQHPAYLEAIRAKLPELQDGDLKDAALVEQQRKRELAEIILIVGEEKDPVPKLMDMVSNPKHHQRPFAVYQLHHYSDARVASWAGKLTLTETDWFLPFCLIDLLGDMPGDEAVTSLVNLLDYSFGNVILEKDIHYTTKDYHNRILEVLQKRTGYHLSADSAVWRAWLQKRDAAGQPLAPLRYALEKRFGAPDRSDTEENYLNYDLATGEILTFILHDESLLGVERSKKTDLKSQAGQRISLVGEYGVNGIDGPHLCVPDGGVVKLTSPGDAAMDGAFVSITGVLEQSERDYRLTGQIEIKKLYPQGGGAAK